MHSAHWHMDQILSSDPLWIPSTLLCVWSCYPMWHSLCGFNIYCILNTISMAWWWYVKYVANSVCFILVVTKHLSPNMPEIRTTQVNKWRITFPFSLVFSSLWDSLTKTKADLATNCRCQVTLIWELQFGSCLVSINSKTLVRSK